MDSVLRLFYFSNMGISISPEASSSISDDQTLPSPDYLTNLNTDNNEEEENDDDNDLDDDSDDDSNNGRTRRRRRRFCD